MLPHPPPLLKWWHPGVWERDCVRPHGTGLRDFLAWGLRLVLRSGQTSCPTHSAGLCCWGLQTPEPTSTPPGRERGKAFGFSLTFHLPWVRLSFWVPVAIPEGPCPLSACPLLLGNGMIRWYPGQMSLRESPMGSEIKAPKPLVLSQLIQCAPSWAWVRMQGAPSSHNAPGPTAHFLSRIAHLSLGQQVSFSRYLTLKECYFCSARAMWPKPSRICFWCVQVRAKETYKMVLSHNKAWLSWSWLQLKKKNLLPPQVETLPSSLWF